MGARASQTTTSKKKRKGNVETSVKWGWSLPQHAAEEEEEEVGEVLFIQTLPLNNTPRTLFSAVYICGLFHMIVSTRVTSFKLTLM